MNRNPHAGLPITDDDATIAKALEDVSIPTLMLSLLHITGNAELIRGALKPQGLFLNEVQGFMSEEDKAEHGDIHILSPWRLVDYWTWTREPNLSDFEIQ